MSPACDFEPLMIGDLEPAATNLRQMLLAAGRVVGRGFVAPGS